MSMTEQFNVQPAPQRKVLGIEFGSTRIKAVLTDGHGAVLATGSHTWENQLVNGIWTYPLEQVWNGLQACYRDMADRYRMRYGSPITVLDAIGFSGMMHGYLAFDRDGNQLVPFRTWRNTITDRAADLLTKQFSFNIPQRWSIAHLYQAILNEEAHVSSIDYMTTLAGYVHWQLTGERVLGVGEASGMFPIDSAAMTYDADMADRFDRLVAGHHFRWKLLDILPQVLPAGVQAGRLTPEGAQLLDPTGELQPGTPFCPPEGDAGTGMVATNSVAERTGNVSAGTSIFAMVVLERPLSQVYPEIDMVMTPDGDPVAMVHCNNCTSEINAWAGMLQEFAHCIGSDLSDDRLYSLLYSKAAEGEKDGGGLLCCNYLSGEPVVDMEEGRPLLVRRPESRLTLGNFMRAQLYSDRRRISQAGSADGPRRFVQDTGGGAENHGCCDRCSCIGYGKRRRGRRVGYRAAGGIYAERRGNDTGAVHGTERLYGYANHRKGSGSRGHCRIYRLYARISGTSGC